MSCFSEKDLVNIYRDLSKNKSYEEGAKALTILSYLEEENINFEEYLNIRDISYKKLVLKKSYMLEELNLVKNNQFKKVGLALSFPDFFIMGYLGSYYYIKIKNNKKEAYLFIKNFFDSCNQQSNARFNKFIDGVIQFFKSTFDISDIEQSFYKITKRNIERETSKLSIYTKKNDIISIVILLKNKKESIWDLNQQHLNSILSILKDIEISNCKNTFKIKELFNCNISDLIFWWRAAYLANENRSQNENPFLTPPKSKINFSTLLIEDNFENRLKFALSNIKNKELMSKEIIDVYKANYLTESYHQLVQSKIREFVHYYNFCFDNKLKVGETKSIKKYKEFKCFDKSNRYTNDVINSLRGYFNAAIKLGYYQDLKSNPVKMTLNVRESKFSKLPDKKIIPPKEVEKLFAIFSKLTKFERLFIMLLYYTGLRIGEALNLTIGCVVKITDNAVTMVIPPFKSRKKPYSILIEDLKVINVIEELILLREGCGRVPHYKTGKAGLFLLIDQTDDGRGIKHLTPEKANRIIEKACSMAGIQKYTNHCFRHTLAHRLLNEEKYDLEDVSALLGHRCLDTIKIYTRLTNEEKLLFYSRYLNRRDAVRKTKSYSNELKVTLKDGRQVIIGSSEGFNRWNGNGFCSHEGEEKCPKKYRSCYTCSLFVACKEKSENMEDDFIINLENLKKELKKTIPIYKEIQFYYNILTSILNHLSSLGVSIEYLLDLSNQSINEAKMILKEMKY